MMMMMRMMMMMIMLSFFYFHLVYVSVSLLNTVYMSECSSSEKEKVLVPPHVCDNFLYLFDIFWHFFDIFLIFFWYFLNFFILYFLTLFDKLELKLYLGAEMAIGYIIRLFQPSTPHPPCKVSNWPISGSIWPITSIVVNFNQWTPGSKDGYIISLIQWYNM